MQASSLLTREQLQLPEPLFCQGKPLIPVKADQFGTRPFSEGLYNLNAWVTHFLAEQREPFVAMGLDGHGIASRAFHYYAAEGPLAVFVQRAHGNATQNLDETRQAINVTFILIQDLFNAMKKHTVPPNKTLLVIDSDFYVKGWGWIDTTSKTLDSENWHREDHPLVLAQQGLTDLQ